MIKGSVHFFMLLILWLDCVLEIFHELILQGGMLQKDGQGDQEVSQGVNLGRETGPCLWDGPARQGGGRTLGEEPRDTSRNQPEPAGELRAAPGLQSRLKTTAHVRGAAGLWGLRTFFVRRLGVLSQMRKPRHSTDEKWQDIRSRVTPSIHIRGSPLKVFCTLQERAGLVSPVWALCDDTGCPF